MTSPVDTTVKYFMSDMPGAPVMNGTAGAMIAVLDACLINGFGLKTVDSLVVSGNVATMTISTGHSHTVDSVALIAGATPAGLNGEQRITAITTTSVSFATTGITDQTATGTITTKVAPAGWLKPFSGTNLAAYKSALPESTGMYLRVDDTETQISRVVGYETMESISVGSGPFPAPSQYAGGGSWVKSMVTNENANNWTVIADSRFFVIFSAPYSAVNPAYTSGFIRAFGDVIAFKPSGDPYACFLCSDFSTSSSSAQISSIGYGVAIRQAMPRGPLGLGGSVLYALSSYSGAVTLSGSEASGGSLGPFPSAIDGGLRLSQMYVSTNGSNQPPRGDIPGVLSVPHSYVSDTFRWGNKIQGTGRLAGKTLITLSPSSTVPGIPNYSTTGVIFVDITGPWR